MAQLLPYIQPGQLKNQPDQVCNVLNRLIDIVNELQKNQ